MALHAREFIWRATAAVSRQLQVCAYPSQGCSSTHALSGMSVRGLYSSPYTYSMRQHGTGSKVVNRGTMERVRIKFPSSTDPSNRLQPLVTNPVRGAKKSVNQPIKTSAEKGLQNLGGMSKNNPAVIKGSPSLDPTQSIHTRPNKKHAIKAKTKNSARKRHKDNSMSLIEPMSKLSKDINQWFTEVMEHLAKAENVSSGAAAEKLTTYSGKRQVVKKEKSTSEVKGQAQRNNVRELGKSSGHANKSAPSFRQENTSVSNRVVDLNCQKGKHNDRILGSSQALRQPNTRCKETTDNLTNQGSTQDKKLSNSGFMNGKESLEAYKTQVSKYNSSVLGNGRENLLEIKPYSVESPGEKDVSLATTASWLTHGSHLDMLSGNPARQGSEKTKGGSKQGGPLAKSAGSATIASEILSGSSKHKLDVSNAASSGGPNTSTPKVSKQNAWEKGKGFILLNNKDKAREALERHEWLRRNQKVQTPNDAKNTGFILVDADKPSGVSSTRLKGSKNILLTDNPHQAAVNRGDTRGDNAAVPNTPKKGSKNAKRAVTTDEANYPFQQKKNAKPKRHGTSTTSIAMDPEVKRWVDLVQRKLFEIQQTKMAPKETSTLNVRQGKGENQIPVKEPADAKQSPSQRNNGGKIERRPEVSNKPSGVSDTRTHLAPTATNNPDVGTGKASLKDPKPVENSDAEYERRISQFIEGTMGYEELSGSSKVSKLFRPLTKAQLEMLELSRRVGIQKYQKDNLNENRVQSKNHSKSVPISDLKPDIKSGHNVGRGNKSPNKKSEPTLCVKPEEIAPVKKLTRTSLIETLGQSNEHTSQEKISTKITKANGDTLNLTNMNEELAFKELRDKKSTNKTASKPSSGGGKTFEGGTNSSLQSHPSNVTANQKSHRKTKKNKTSKSKMNSSQEGTKTHIKSTMDSTISPRILNTTEPHRNVSAAFLQHEFLKLQQEKLDKSRAAKSLPETNCLSAKGQDMEPNGTLTSHLNTLKGEKERKNTDIVSSLQPKTSFIIIEPPLEENITIQSKTEFNSKALGSKRKTPVDNASSTELDPFEAWIQSMEDWKAADTNKPSSSSWSVATADPNKKPEPKPKEKKKYPRFEAKISPKEALQNNQVPVSTSGHSRVSALGVHDLESRPEKTPLKVMVNTVSQSDQLYNMIAQESTRPLSGLPLHGFITSPARKSKVLTQAGMGAVISSSTGLADSAKMPKLGNLFSSFDGFIAMDATPVIVEPPRSSPKTGSSADTTVSSSTKTAAQHGDGLFDNDLRASLAREREAASFAARKKLIDEYEKSIEKYEKSLELFRNRLRRVRQTMAEDKEKQIKSPKEKTDNPRRHSDL